MAVSEADGFAVGPVEELVHLARRLVVTICLILPLLFQAGLAVDPAAAADQTPTPASSFVAQPESDQPKELIGKGYFTVTIAPGQAQTVRLAVKNTGTEALQARIQPLDGVQGNDGINFTAREKTATGPGTWLSPSPDRLALPPNESGRVTVSVKVPDNTAPGEYVAGITVENERAQSEGTGSRVLIDIYYRRTFAVVVTVPGTQSPAWSVGGVTLTSLGKGSQARVDVANTGNVLMRGKGTIEIGGGQASSGVIPFTVGTIMPGSTSGLAAALPNLTLKPGAYDVKVKVEAENGGPVAEWQGSVSLAVPTAVAASAPAANVLLDPASAAAQAATQAQSNPLLLVAGVLLVLVLGAAIGVIVARRAIAKARTEGAK